MITALKEVSALLNVSVSTLHRWIRKGKLEAVINDNGRLELVDSQNNSNFIWKKFHENADRPAEPFVPEGIIRYNNWHTILDELAWLFKICYSDKDRIKRKKFKLELIFQNYLKDNKVTLSKLSRIFESNDKPRRKMISDDLQRGWYNELSFLVPLKKSTLGISFTDLDINSEISFQRFAFPSWKIIETYYSIYFYLRAITLLKTSNFRLEEHKSTITCFKNNLLKPLERVIWKFPLDISYTPELRYDRKSLYLNRLDHLKYQYTFHPRPPHKDAFRICEDIYNVFRKKAKAKNSTIHYTVFDFLLEFRIWANYLEIDNLLSLHSSGFKGFLDQNLSLLLFMIGGISELCFISVLGSQKYTNLLQRFYDLFASNNPELEKEFSSTAIFQRSFIYQKLGFIEKTIQLRPAENLNVLELLELG